MDIVCRFSLGTSPTFAELWIWGVWVITLKHNFVPVWLKGFSVFYWVAEGTGVQVRPMVACDSCPTC